MKRVYAALRDNYSPHGSFQTLAGYYPIAWLQVGFITKAEDRARGRVITRGVVEASNACSNSGHCGTRTTGLLLYSTAVPRQEWHDPCRCRGEGCCCAWWWWWSRLRVSSSQSCCTRPLERPSSFIPTWLGVGVGFSLGRG